MSPSIPHGRLTTVTRWQPENDERHQRLELSGVRLPGATLSGVELQSSHLVSVVLDGAELEASTFTDCLLEDCSLANVSARRSALVRVAIARGRLTGLSWTTGGIRDVTFSQCRMDFATFRLQKFGTVRFCDCELRDSDFHEADLRGARFERCDLTGADFSNANLTGASLRGCTYERLRGVEALRGATVGYDDLFSLSPAMANAIGIAVHDDQEPG